MELELAGYRAFRPIAPPEWMQAPNAVEVCSVSSHAFHIPGEWHEDTFLLNGMLGFCLNPEEALGKVPAGAPGVRVFAFKCPMIRYHGGAEEPWGLDFYPSPLDGDYHSLGFDVASRYIDDILGFGCSGPMCYGVGAEVEVNCHGLIDTLEQAVALAERL